MHSEKKSAALNYKMFSSLINEEDKEKLDSILDTVDFFRTLCSFASEAGLYDGNLPSKQISNFLSIIHSELNGVVSRAYSPGGTLHISEIKKALSNHT